MLLPRHDMITYILRTSGVVEFHTEDGNDGRPVDGADHAVAIGYGPDHAGEGEQTCALRATGDVVCWTHPATSATKTIPGITDAIAMTATGRSVCVLHKTGKVSCWGVRGSLGDGSEAELTTPVTVENLTL